MKPTVFDLPCLLALMIATVLSSPVHGQCPPPAWSSMNQIPGVDSWAYAMTSWDPDGAGPASPVLVVGGHFAVAGGVAANRIATWDGTAWQALGSGMAGPTFYNGIFALAVYNGDLVAAGSFTSAGGVAANGIARWDGTSWQPLGTGMAGPTADTRVAALAVFNGDLIAGGAFSFAGGVAAANIARWNGSSWQPLGTGLTGASSSVAVYSLAVYNGELIAGGEYTTAGGLAANCLARWNGSSWQSLGTGVSNGPFVVNVSSLAAYNGDLIVGGAFSTAGGVAASNIARWNGQSWLPMGTGLAQPYVNDLTAFNGELIACGSFSSTGGVAVFYIARWNGSVWQPLGSGMNAYVHGLAVYNGELIAAGDFTVAGGATAQHIARWNGSSWQAFGIGLDSSVVAFTTAANGQLVAAGAFGGTPQVARWNGASWQTLGSGMSAVVSALTTYNGDVIAGGSFLSAGGTVAYHIARWNGSAWLPLGAGLDGAVKALTVYNGVLIAGGSFTTSDGLYFLANIAQWNGSSWLPLGNGLAVSNEVLALTVYNGQLIAGGSFANYNHIAGWNGTSWQFLGTGVNGSVNALAVYNGGLIAGGDFTAAGPVLPNRVASWNGSMWQPLGSGVNGTVKSLTTYGGELIAGGAFNQTGASPLDRIGRWNGSSWQPMGAGIGGTEVRAMIVQDGALFAGGAFLTAGGLTTPFFARWSSPLPLLQLSQPGGPGGPVQVANRWLIPGHEYYNFVSLDLAPGGPGTGPYGGLWFNDPASLLQQFLLPLGSLPIHFLAPGTDTGFGPYTLPLGLQLEALSVDVTGNAVGCISSVVPYTVY